MSKRLCRVAFPLVILCAVGTAQAQQAMLALEVSGPASNAGKEARCLAVAQRSGIATQPGAPVRVRLTLANGANHLQIISPKRGVIYDQPKPGWGMDQLCQDAFAIATNLLAHENDPPAPATALPASPPGPAPVYASRIAFDVLGPMANPRKQLQCYGAAQRQGLVVDPQAPVRVVLTLNPGVNQLSVTSTRRGLVSNTTLPPWGMDQLCQSAISEAMRAIAQEGAAPIAQAAPAPMVAPQALGPIPPGKDLPPAAKKTAARAIAAWQASQFEQALDLFREAARSNNDPQFLFDRAVCEQRLARYAEARSHAQLFIDIAPQSPYRAYADQLLGELSAQATPVQAPAAMIPAPQVVVPPPQTVVVPTIQVGPGYGGPGYGGPVIIAPQQYCEYTSNCAPGQFCRDRGDGIKLCMGNGMRNSYCAWGSDCGPGMFCRDRGDGAKVCMP